MDGRGHRYPDPVAVRGDVEMSHSGLVRPPAKRVEVDSSRGFKSRHLRHMSHVGPLDMRKRVEGSFAAPGWSHTRALSAFARPVKRCLPDGCCEHAVVGHCVSAGVFRGSRVQAFGASDQTRCGSRALMLARRVAITSDPYDGPGQPICGLQWTRFCARMLPRLIGCDAET